MRRPRLIDVLAAVAIAIAGIAELVGEDELAHEPVLVALTLLVAAPLAWRSALPLHAIAITGFGIVASALLGNNGVDNISFAFALLLATYSTGSHLPRRPALYGLGASFAVMYAMAILVEPREVGNFLFGPFFFGVIPWSIGRAVRRRDGLVRRLAAQREELQRTREQRAMLAVQDERTRIARDLHDTVAHAVAAMVVQAEGGRSALDRDIGMAVESAESIETAGRQALDELRELLGVLRRGDEQLALAPQPTLDRIGDLIARARAAGVDVRLTVEGDPGDLPRGAGLTAYRIVQEALANVLRHAGGAGASVVLRHAPDGLEIEVEDSGSGAQDRGRDGHGLTGMRERAALHGGTLEAGPVGGGGWVVRARLPRERVVAG
jgi:signal transduction histidine kinase